MPRRKPKPESPEQPSQVLQTQIIKGGREVPALYANTIQLLVSLFDITLIVGQAGPGPDGELEVREVARLSLSPQHAKALTGALVARIAEYEKQFGTIVGSPNEPPPPS